VQENLAYLSLLSRRTSCCYHDYATTSNPNQLGITEISLNGKHNTAQVYHEARMLNLSVHSGLLLRYSALALWLTRHSITPFSKMFNGGMTLESLLRATHARTTFTCRAYHRQLSKPLIKLAWRCATLPEVAASLILLFSQ
jgi:hypothetical protein